MDIKRYIFMTLCALADDSKKCLSRYMTSVQARMRNSAECNNDFTTI